MTGGLLDDVQDHTAVISFDRPVRLNACSNEMLDAWQESNTRASADCLDVGAADPDGEGPSQALEATDR